MKKILALILTLLMALSSISALADAVDLIVPSDDLVTDAEAPEDETETPEGDTEAPEEDTEAPEDETETPEGDTEAPEEDTEAPEEDTEASEDETETPEDEDAQICWYVDNTANVFGPKVDGSWQTYAAVDLSADGVQSFYLIGAGAWKIGTVTVTVEGDSVVVDYQMTEDIIAGDVWDDITVDAEYVNIFADAASIDMQAESAFAFGEPISISADLGGDTTVALFIRNVVDYPSHSPYVTRFWSNAKVNASIAEAMAALMAE